MARGLCAGVWVGGEDRCIHFRTLALGGGARTARPIWEKFMLSIYEDLELPYEKGPLLDYAQPIDVDIPTQHKQPQDGVPSQETEEDAIIEEEEDVVETELDVNEIF